MPFCTKCGNQVEQGDGFCRKCGAQVAGQVRRRRADAHKANIGPAEKIVGFCDTCQGEWYAGDMKCRHCNADDYTTILPDTSEDPSSLPISNSLAWWIAFVPLIGLVAENLVAVRTEAELSQLAWITIVLNIALSLWDSARLRKWFPNLNPISSFLVPVYLYKRAKLLKQNLAYFFVWIACFAVLLFIPSHLILDNPNFNFGLGSATTINSVKNGHFIAYPDVAIGKALDKYLENEKWTSFIADGGGRYVQVTGTIVSPEGMRQELLMQFLIDGMSNSRFSLGAGTLNGRQMSNREVMDHFLKAYELSGGK